MSAPDSNISYINFNGKKIASAAVSDALSLPSKPLKIWLITDGKAGMDVQCIGVAEALKADYEFKHVAPFGPWRWMAPWGPAPFWETPGKPKSIFHPPWPDVAIATGRSSIPYLQALRKVAGKQMLSVILQDPRMGSKGADLIWVPEHDKLRADNVMTTLTSPHAYTAARLKDLRFKNDKDILALPGPRVTVILGGANSVYRYSENALRRLSNALDSFVNIGASFLITPSRRTQPEIIKTVDLATQSSPRILWNGEGENPYGRFLAYADYLIVTADSVNMTGEACATGKPVYVFTPDGGSQKFNRFHQALQAYGASRPLPDNLKKLENWTYKPLDSASVIAAEILRYLGKRST